MMDRRLTDLLLTLLVILAFIAGCNWKKNPCSDTVIPGKPDTVKVVVHDTIVYDHPVASSSRPAYPPQPKPAHPTDTGSVANTGYLPSDCDSIRDYTLYSRDSSVKVSSSVHGVLLHQVIDAQSTTVTINRTDTMIKSPKLVLFGGVNLTMGMVAPTLTVARNKSYISVGYNVVDKMPVVGYGVMLFRSRR